MIYEKRTDRMIVHKSAIDWLIRYKEQQYHIALANALFNFEEDNS